MSIELLDLLIKIVIWLISDPHWVTPSYHVMHRNSYEAGIHAYVLWPLQEVVSCQEVYQEGDYYDYTCTCILSFLKQYPSAIWMM